MERFISLLAPLFLVFTSQQAFSYPAQGEHLWQPSNGVNRTQWLACHGFSCDKWKRVKSKMARLAAMQVAAGFVPALGLSGSAVGANPRQSWLPPDIALDSDLDAVDGCIKLTEEQADEMISNFNHFLYNSGKKRRKRKVLNFSKLSFRKWTDFPIKFKFDGKHKKKELNLIRSAVRHWEAQTCIRFQEVDMDANLGRSPHLLFTREGTGCHSFIGKVPIVPQQLNLQYTCLWEFGIPVHEIGHALGFWHEHQRWDRDADIKVYWDNVGYYTSQYYKQPTVSLGVPYDVSSVMHYGPRDGSVNGQNVMETRDPLYQSTMGQKTGLSFLDTKAMNKVYCQETCRGYRLAKSCERGGYQDPNDCSRCRCPDGFGGRFCETLAPAQNAQCGGYLVASGVEQVIQSPNYDTGAYKDHQECTWIIRAPTTRHRVKLWFVEKFGLFCYKQDQCHHWVEVKYKREFDYPGPRFCCYERPTATLISNTQEMVVIMRTNWTTFWDTFRVGFKAMYIAVREDGSPADLPNIPPAPTPAPTPYPTAAPTPYPTPPPTPYPTPPPTPYPTPPPTPYRTPYPTQPPTPYRTPPQTPAPPPTRAPWTPAPPGPDTNRLTPVPPRTNNNKDCKKMDVAFILDSSGSIGLRNWQVMLNFVKEVSQRFIISPYDVRIGVISYGNYASMDIGFKDHLDVSSLVSAIDRIPWKDQWTNTSGALWIMRTQLFSEASGDRAEVPDYAILITDGEANLDGHLTMFEADMAIRRGIKTLVIGIGDKINALEVAGIAVGSAKAYSLPSPADGVENVVRVRDFQEFISIETVARATKFICPSYTSNPPIAGTPRPPWSWSCGFEDYLSPLCGMQQDPNDQFDFTRWTGTTPSEVTGPEAANSGQFYIYMEASNPRREGDRAIIRLPSFYHVGPHCLRFYYHMFGYHIRSLEVFLQAARRTTFPWQKSGQQGREWLEASVDVYLEYSDLIGFAATRGAEYSGDIAIDDISVTQGFC